MVRMEGYSLEQKRPDGRKRPEGRECPEAREHPEEQNRGNRRSEQGSDCREEALQNRVRRFSFFLTVLVIWAHAYNAELFLGAAGREGLTGWLERFLGGGVAQAAVPGFFMISSALFFRNYELNWASTANKWKRRVRSLLIPYFLWNLLYYAGYVIGSRIPVLTAVIGKGEISCTWEELCRAVLLYRYHYVFWYVFQLLLLTLLSPLIYWIAEERSRYWIGAAALLWIIARRMDGTPLNADALFYYMGAARITCLVRKGEGRAAEALRRLRNPDPGGGVRALWAVLLIGFMLWQNWSRIGGDLLTVLLRFAGVAALWILLPDGGKPTRFRIVRETFFIYAIHFAPVRLFNKTGNLFAHGSSAAALFLYVGMPGLIVLMTAMVSAAGRRYAPRLYGLFTGGRGTPGWKDR